MRHRKTASWSLKLGKRGGADRIVKTVKAKGRNPFSAFKRGWKVSIKVKRKYVILDAKRRS